MAMASQSPAPAELLLHFSDKTFLRMAGHVDDRGDRVPVGRKVAEAKLDTLDAYVGTKRWRMLSRRAPTPSAQSTMSRTSISTSCGRAAGSTPLRFACGTTTPIGPRTG